MNKKTLIFLSTVLVSSFISLATTAKLALVVGDKVWETLCVVGAMMDFALVVSIAIVVSFNYED